MIDGRLAWGILSTSRINASLLPPLKASARSRVVAVASREVAKARDYASTWGLGRAYGSYEELLADGDLDVVYISLPNHLHAEWAVKALRAGKHVLCEKPLALSVAEIDTMTAEAAKAGRVLAEAFMYRHHPQTRLVRELVAGGAIGKPASMRGSFTFRMKSESDHRLLAASGGGSIWDVGCYPVSLARHLAGTEPLEAWGRAMMGRGGVDESFFGELLFPGDLVFQFDSGFRSPYRTRFEVSGELGTLVVESPFKPQGGDKVIIRREDRVEEIAVSPAELYAGEVADLEACVLDGKAPAMDLADSRGNAAALAALLASAREGRPTRL